MWDAVLPLLQPETAAAYPNPWLCKWTWTLSAESYVTTANSTDRLPAPFLDRCRVVEFPGPSPDDLDRLLPPLIRDHAAGTGMDRRWVEPLTAEERGMVAARWRSESV